MFHVNQRKIIPQEGVSGRQSLVIHLGMKNGSTRMMFGTSNIYNAQRSDTIIVSLLLPLQANNMLAHQTCTRRRF
jgi:hypothetical protein